MNIELLERAKRIVADSRSLSSLEKAEWLQLLPQMNDKQIFELMKILAPQVSAQMPQPPAPPAAAQPKPATAPAPAMTQPKVDITQKEISTSAPLYEKELPAPKQTAPAPVKMKVTMLEPSAPAPQPQSKPSVQMPPPAPVSQPHPATFEEIRAQAAKLSGVKIETKPELRSESKSETLPPLPPLIRPDAPPEVSKIANAVAQVQENKKNAPQSPQPKGDLQLNFSKPEDFSALKAEMLHGREAFTVLQQILNEIANFVKNKKTLQVVYNIEQSPLYQSYVQYGLSMLDQKHTQQELTKEEFEAFTDFRKEIDKLVI